MSGPRRVAVGAIGPKLESVMTSRGRWLLDENNAHVPAPLCSARKGIAQRELLREPGRAKPGRNVKR